MARRDLLISVSAMFDMATSTMFGMRGDRGYAPRMASGATSPRDSR